LWTVAAAGGEPVRVTNDPALDWSPAWSHDGRYLYFSSDRSGGWNLWRVAIDEATGRPGGEPETLAIPREGIGHVSVSASGSAIAMASMSATSNLEGLAFDPASGTVGARRRITASSDRSTVPVVSPDGQWIVFSKAQQGGQEVLWVVRRDGTGLRQVTDGASRDRLASWMAGGTRLMFQSSRDGARFQVWTIAADGGTPIQVTDRPESLIFPLGSPDGTRALVATFPLAKLLTFDPRVPAAQQHIQEVPVFAGGFAPTSWFADGTRVAGFALARPGFGIVIYSEATQKYEEVAAAGRFPAWLPDGRRLLYVSGVSDLILLDTATKRSTVVFSSPAERVGTGLGLSPDAREIYVGISKQQSDIVLAKLPGPVP
jgi:Tol biopolymer transport system component